MTNQQTASPEQKKGTGKALQIVLSLILFAGFVAFLFVPNAAGFEQSLFNQILDLFKGESLFATALAKAGLYAVVGMYAVLLICTVASFFSKRDGAAALNFIKTLVCVAATAFYAVVLIKEFEMTATDIFYDEKSYVAINATCLSMLLGLVGMAVLSIATYKGKGVVKLFYALIAGAFFVFATRTFVASHDLQALFNGIELGEGLSDTIAEYAFRFLAWGALINLMLAVIGFAFPHFAAIDLIRAIAMFILAAAGTVFAGLEGGFANLTENIGMLGFAGVALVQLVYTIIVVAVGHSKLKKKREAEEEAAEKAENAELNGQPAQPFVFDSNDQMAIRGYESPAQEEPAAEAPAAPAVSEEVQREAERANQAFDEAAQISFDDIAKTAAAQEQEQEQAATAQEAIHEEYSDAVRDIPAQEKAEENPFDFEQAKYDGKFNRAYADYAAQEEQRRQQQAQQPYYGQPYAQQQPYYGQTYAQQPPVAPANGQSYYAAGYIPDAFFSSLTPAEKDEFDRLFISRIYGDNKRLPAYRLGGDNREFFTKIFVFMGRYRSVISDGLLEKIYNFSNSIR